MEVLFEFKQIGRTVQVIAIDAETGTEVSLQAPAGLSQADMQRQAIAKLRYVLNKQKADKES
ncbi:MAG: serine hydroxymethyltransferase [Bdellovibrionales bacterium]